VNERFQPHLKEIVQKTGCNSSVAVLQGTEIVYIASAAVKRLVRLPAAVGVRFPAYATAMGRVLLANRSRAELTRYFQSAKPRRLTEATEIEPARLNRILAEVKENGYSVSQDQLEMGLFSIAVPLHGSNGAVIAAMNCSSIADGTDSKKLISTRLKVLKEYVEPIEKALAVTPEFERAVRSDPF
jgi:IclR family pca regulon transcriptional regulator